MSTKSVLVWIVLAVVLGGAVLISLRTGSIGGPPNALKIAGVLPIGQRLFDFAPSSVRSVSVAHPDASTDIVERRPPPKDAAIGFDSEWFLTTQPRSGTPPLP